MSLACVAWIVHGQWCAESPLCPEKMLHFALGMEVQKHVPNKNELVPVKVPPSNVPVIFNRLLSSHAVLTLLQEMENE